MKIKLVEPGWEGFTGLFGATLFEEGVSVEDVSKGEAQHLSALIRIETLEGKDPSVSQEIVDRNNELAPLIERAALNDNQQVDQPEREYTQAELEELADKGGIAALRDIAEKLGLKGRSIPELISRIFEKTRAKNKPQEDAGEAAEAAPAADPAADPAAEAPAVEAVAPAGQEQA